MQREDIYSFEKDPIFQSLEKIPTRVFDKGEEGAIYVANTIKALILEKQAKQEKCVLGLATGSTPIKVYQILIKMHQQEELSFKNVITFNLDEYYPMHPKALQSYHRFMHENFFDEIDILKENIHIPLGDIPFYEIEGFCKKYEKKIHQAGGIDLQILGIGKTGHIGFNEPGSSIESKTRLVYLDQLTLIDAASDFFGRDNVPAKAITMGISTILKSKQILLMAFSETKGSIIKKAVEGEISEEIPASLLQTHRQVSIILDRPAAEKLTRFKCPWVIKGTKKHAKIDFNEYLIQKAVIWSSIKLSKAISKLTEEDYEKNGLNQLIEHYQHLMEISGSPSKKKAINHRGQVVSLLNNYVLQELNSKFTVYPVGDEDKKKVLVFSPHPDDDVICMAGTMLKMTRQGHDVYVAYQTSGNIAVYGHDVQRYANFMTEAAKLFNWKSMQEISQLEQKILAHYSRKKPGQTDIPEILQLQGQVRKSEGMIAANSVGVPRQNIRNMDLPFYETGRVKKKPISEIDIKLCKKLMEEIKPDFIFAAGDLTDPHGTHRSALMAILQAFEEFRREKVQWFLDVYNNDNIFLYRGAWQEWEIDKVSLAIPLTPEEINQKIKAIHRHESQKDTAMFPGHDNREFWQRSRDRNEETAMYYNKLGLPEYQAIEVFVTLQNLEKLYKIF